MNVRVNNEISTYQEIGPLQLNIFCVKLATPEFVTNILANTRTYTTSHKPARRVTSNNVSLC